MGRIVKAYETQFTWLLEQAGARKKEAGVRRMIEQAQHYAMNDHLALAAALTQTYERLSSHRFFQSKHNPGKVRGFFCDAGLGGLARWLRAAGYKADWVEGIDDDVLLEAVRGRGTVLLTTDSMLMERRLLRNKAIPSFWLPPILSIRRQIELVMREFRLPLRPPLCMSCGGELLKADKQEMSSRIPPRTFRWLDEYFVCENCGQLFWHGTHWLRIRRGLEGCGAR